ncbi:predicted protein [Naegleria gruberi]|uniref:Predicted protein n=1 Tax=Naegleria gruberi TaxID=5762 RepID=D2V4U3_NAEGR|nr:uncharacterized protein NAEGRDRAFT_46719 [Naegleria gruberi]EFC48162.1 predicted protein [Naegleria gruberi]|eukprot:XP_002680906.1 predicted protein [Naegleria gruberi strain NEG-M]
MSTTLNIGGIKYRYLVEEPILNYVRQVGMREQSVLEELRKVTMEKLGLTGYMLSFPEQTQLLQMIIKLMGASNILDIGCFTGYSALSFALASENVGGKVVTLDISQEWTSIGKPYWEKAGVSDRINLRLQPALDSLKELEKEGQLFDFIYIDADKDNQLEYVEYAYKLLRQNGLLVIDNVIWSTKVMDKDDHSPGTDIIRQMNEQLHTDERWDISMQVIGDGATFLRKK